MSLRYEAWSGHEWLSSRRLALLSAGVLVGAVVVTLYSIIDVVGDAGPFLGLVAGTLVVATGLSWVLPERIALGIGLLALVGGLWVYTSALGVDVFGMYRPLLFDVVSMLSGLSVLRIAKIDLWVLSVTPPPVFLTWYLALRGRYVVAVLAGGLPLGFFVLTGDVGTPITLLGVIGATGTIGFGRLERFGGDHATDVLAVVLAAMVVLTMTVSVVPGQTDQPIQLAGAGGDRTVDANLMGYNQEVTIQGSIELSPDVRFTVESDQRAYWRVAGYNRYTGDGWVSTGASEVYSGPQSEPVGESERIEQQYRVESDLAVMPAAWRPVRVTDTSNARVSSLGGLVPASPFSAGDTYRVESERPVADPSALATAGDDYPDRLETEYTQLPASVPDRVGERTDRITANANTSYEVAVQIEQYLENNKAYSLDVERPDGDVADAFLFEMDQGYCTYYATTMVTMLRTQGIPARFVTGYTPGEETGDGEYVVRGLDSHAWVEVYFPDTGWVKFDPTPAGPRTDAEAARLEGAGLNDAGGAGDSDDDTPTTETPTDTPVPTTGATPRPPTVSTPEFPPAENGTTTAQPGTATTTDSEAGGLPLPEPPSSEEIALGLVVLAGLAAVGRRTGLAERAYRVVWLRWQPRDEPERDIERAFDRVEYLLAREHRPRRAGETPRQYLAAIDADERARQVYDCYERAEYAGTVTAELADEAVRAADAFVGDRL